MPQVTPIGAVTHAEDNVGTGGTWAATRNGILQGSNVVVLVTCGDLTTLTSVSDGITTKTIPDGAYHWVAGTQWLYAVSFPNHPGGNFTFTATYSSGTANFRGIRIVELTPSRFDVSTGAEGSSAAPNSGNLTPSANLAYLIGYSVCNTAATVGAGFTDLFNDPTVIVDDTEGKAVASIAAVSAAWTMASGPWSALAVVYIDATLFASEPSQFPRKRLLLPGKPFGPGNPLIEMKYGQNDAVVGGTTYFQTLDGGATPSGDVTRQALKVLGGSVTPTGIISKFISKLLGGGVTPTGAALKQSGKTLAGGATPTGDLAKRTSKLLGGGATPTGALARQANKTLAGGATPAGTLAKQTSKTLAGGATPAGTLFRLMARVFGGGITPTGTLTRVRNLLLGGGATPAGAVTRRANKALGGGATPTGALSRLISKALAGGVTPAGALTQIRVFIRTMSGGVTPTGTVTRQANKALGGNTTPTGALTRVAQHKLTLAGGISPSGALSKLISKVVSGGATPAGALATIKVFLRTMSGGVTPTGTLTRLANKALGGGVTPGGTLARRIFKTIVGGVTPTGALATAKTRFLTLAGGVTPTGAVIRRAGKNLLAFIQVGFVNIAIWSEDFSQAVWAKNNMTPATGFPSPDGGNNATRMTSTVNGSAYLQQSPSSQPGQKLTWSIHAFAGSTPLVNLEFHAQTWSDGGNGPGFNLATGTKIGGIASDTITPVPGFPGWYRLSGTRTAKGVTAQNAIFIGNPAGTAIIGDSVIFWGAQLDQGSVLTPYRKTLALPVRSSPLTRKMFRPLAGGVTPTGTLTRSKFLHLILSGGVTPVGTLTTFFGSAWAYFVSVVYGGAKLGASLFYAGPKIMMTGEPKGGPKLGADNTSQSKLNEKKEI